MEGVGFVIFFVHGDETQDLAQASALQLSSLLQLFCCQPFYLFFFWWGRAVKQVLLGWPETHCVAQINFNFETILLSQPSDNPASTA